MKKYFAVKDQDRSLAVAFLLVRLVMGLAFILHGWGKIQTPMSWMGPDAPVPGVFQFLAAFSEFGGGIALLLGLLTRLATLGMGFTMLVAVYTHMIVMGDPFVNPKGTSYELALVYLILAVMFVLNGPGVYSLDRKIFGRRA